MSALTDAVARLQHSRQRWGQLQEQDARIHASRPWGAVSGLLQGLGAQPWQSWLSTASALWMTWRRHRPAPLPAAPTRSRRLRSGMVAGTLLVTAVVAFFWWRRRSASAPH